MNGVNFHTEPFSIFNPYKVKSNLKGKMYAALFKNAVTEKAEDAFVDLADQITEWGKNVLFHDFEQRIEVVGKGATVLDWGVYIPVAALQGSVLAKNLFDFSAYPIFQTFSTLYNILVIPATSILIGLAMVEGVAEFANLKRAKGLLKKMQEKKDPLSQMEWIKKRYFTLHPKEAQKIESFIEFTMSKKSQEAKVRRFDSIAEKAMKVKYQSLKRRLTPKLAEEVRTEILDIEKNLKSWNPFSRRNATQKAEHLMETITLQAKNKIFIHFLTIVALATSIISMAILVAGISLTPLIAPLGAISVLLFGIAFLVNKVDASKAVEHYYNNMPASYYQTVSKKLYSICEEWAPQLLPHQS